MSKYPSPLLAVETFLVCSFSALISFRFFLHIMLWPAAENTYLSLPPFFLFLFVYIYECIRNMLKTPVIGRHLNLKSYNFSFTVYLSLSFSLVLAKICFFFGKLIFSSSCVRVSHPSTPRSSTHPVATPLKTVPLTSRPKETRTIGSLSVSIPVR